MRKILIVGAGQAGLQVALSLQVEGYEVTIMSARTPDELRVSWPPSTQTMFHCSLEYERAYGLNLWEDEAPRMSRVGVSVAPEPGVRAIKFDGSWAPYAMSVDQRMKMAAWLELFEDRGGRIIYHPVMTSDLAGLAKMYDLTLIAAGKGEIVELFDRDAVRSKYTKPGRALAAIFVQGMVEPDDFPENSMRINVVPGVGELFVMRSLTMNGPSRGLLLEAMPDGPLDCFWDRPQPEEHVRRLRHVLREYLPWEAELMEHCEPTDARASLTGSFTGVVRKPYAEVDQDTYVFGMGDVVVLNDPIAGQGSNAAAHCAGIYTQAILDRGERPFDAEWMQATFETFWEKRAQHATGMTDALLNPMPDHVQQLLGAATQHQEIADRFADLFPNPDGLGPLLGDPEKTLAYIAEVAEADAATRA